jgi:hypothetical protein
MPPEKEEEPLKLSSSSFSELALRECEGREDTRLLRLRDCSVFMVEGKRQTASFDRTDSAVSFFVLLPRLSILETFLDLGCSATANRFINLFEFCGYSLFRSACLCGICCRFFRMILRIYKREFQPISRQTVCSRPEFGLLFCLLNWIRPTLCFSASNYSRCMRP